MSKEQGREKGFAFIVGGTGGIGEAICRRLVTDWDGIFFTFRSKKAAAEELRAELSPMGMVECLPMELRDSKSIRSALEQAMERGPVRAVIFAGGVNILQPMVSTVTQEQWVESIETELIGFTRLVTEALPLFRKQGGGIFASLTSSGNYRFPPGDALSAVPKAGIEMLSKAIAREEGRYGIRSNCVGPGVIDAGLVKNFQEVLWTKETLDAIRRQIPLKRLGEASEVADAIAFLISSRATYITGQTILVDGGFSL